MLLTEGIKCKFLKAMSFVYKFYLNIKKFYVIMYINYIIT